MEEYAHSVNAPTVNVFIVLGCTHSINVSAQPMQHFSYRPGNVETCLYSNVHFEDKLLLSMREKCGNMSI